MSIPPIPAWDALHPLIVHFPIGLLLVAPLLIVLGLARARWRSLLNAALVLMILGTTATWFAVATGEAAGELAPHRPGVEAALERHEEMAETTRTVFTILTLVYAALLAAPRVLRRQPKRLVETAGGAAFLLGYAFAAVLLAGTAHEGGRLVHVHGVHAIFPAEPAATATGPAASSLLDVLDTEAGAASSRDRDRDDDH